MPLGSTHTELTHASEWVAHWAATIPQYGKVLDIACGRGRHAVYLANLGYNVNAVDNDSDATQLLEKCPGVTCRVCDLESQPWPFAQSSFDGVVVSNYLHRPLFPHIVDAITSGGALIYETFARGNEKYGKPTNPNFLLGRGELLDVVRSRFHVIAYEDLDITSPRPACVQRICARKL